MFGDVATHNHFVLDRGGKVFKQTAPVIKLPADATEDDHLALLGLLNSSTRLLLAEAGLSQQGKHGRSARWHASGLIRSRTFTRSTAPSSSNFPLPAERPLALARQLDGIGGVAVRADAQCVCCGRR